jgi:hypothetical protein
MKHLAGVIAALTFSALVLAGTARATKPNNAEEEK